MYYNYPNIEESRSKINDLFNGKSIVYFPIVSMQNRETGNYKLDQDGNVNRFITFFSKCNTMKQLYITLPSNKETCKYYTDFAESKNNITTIYNSNFGQHALDQRVNKDIITNQYNASKEIIDNSDIIIVESQGLSNLILSNNPNKIIIYWCPVSVTNKKTRSFIEQYREIDKELFNKVNYIIVVSPEQYDYLIELEINSEKILYYYELMDRSLPIFNHYNHIDTISTKKIIYLPFRLTDEGYKSEQILDVLEQLSIKYPNKFVIVYSDPNNSKFDRVTKNPDLYFKIPSDRDTYYSYLDSKNVLIPYFEDINYVNHASIHEFNNEQSKCTVLLNNTEYHAYNIKRKDILYIDFEDLYKNLEKFINE